MENRITTLFGIRYPVIAGGMVWCSGWRLAAAVSEAGGLGLIGSGSMTPELLREHIRKCRAATSRPFGVNVPLAYRYTPQLMEVIAEERVPAVFTSAGSPATWTGRLHDAGCRVAHVVSSSKFALKSRDAGVDAVVAEGFEAGGHNGREETTTMALVPQVRQAVDLPLIAAGGIATGAGMAGRLRPGRRRMPAGNPLRAVAGEFGLRGVQTAVRGGAGGRHDPDAQKGHPDTPRPQRLLPHGRGGREPRRRRPRNCSRW